MLHKIRLWITGLFFPLAVIHAQTGNIAGEAKISASTSLSETFRPAHVADGVIGVPGIGEWACEGVTTDWGYIRFPWIKLEWEQPRTIDRVVLYDRPSEKEFTAGGKLVFSDGSIIWVNRIPNNGEGKEIKFDAKTVEWVEFRVTDGNGSDLGFSEIEVFAAPEENNDFVSWVDPYIETNRGRYLFFITGSRPFGMVGAAPLTRNKNQNGGGYNYNDGYILGFEQIHSWMLGGLEIMPATSTVNPAKGQQEWKSAFSHEDEIVQPGYQRVYLKDHHTWAELTSTERVSFYRFRFTRDMEAQILLNLGGYVSNINMENARILRSGKNAIEGYFSTTGRFWGGPRDVKVFFAAEFDRPFKRLDGWKGKERHRDIREISGDSTGSAAMYDVKAGDMLKMKIAISYTSIENAKNNLREECPHWDFDQVHKDSRNTWNDWLGKIEVKGGSRAQKIKFYTDLWHVLLGRQKINDISGDYPDRTAGHREGTFTDAEFTIKKLPEGKNGKLKFNMYNSDAWWLTQWNLNVLWGLAWPEVMDEMSASMVQYAVNGGLLPRGPCGGGYSYIMTGSPATNLIASAFQKGLLTKADHGLAYEKVKQNLLPGGMLGAKEDIEFYTENGYWPGNAGITLEAAFQDYALSRMAKVMGREEDHRFFSKRAGGWKTLFNPEQKLIFPKDRKGNFLYNDPLSGEGWIEANAWQATWSVSHQIDGLAALMGGEEVLCDKLNYAFEMAAPDDFVFAYNEGYISYANQPGCSNAHVFNHAGKPWLTQYWVRKVKERAYGGITPDLGYGGHDEDQGQMGAVSALMAIGLFSLDGNVSENPKYDITSPVFDEIAIKLDRNYYAGKEFKIITHNNSPENMYIQKALLNGEDHTRFWFRHKTFQKGGSLELYLGPEPNMQWGIKD
ncbi:GH92 family glycosyl hydrolase [Sinomicrobium weinanense]|uniref:Glycoside hydrolase family 92 protein n=1 Tax=Sinomicrobium weinanense TaxID=2842200 RepID=A0A926JT36_9FLAO|nr:GH92 family glycosyl hydrolase [Sinomicrobium weinanense]MBC9797025.1 glycoside hydrolase family 92 protein [Sinomicrobium weinanense]MBU3123277.1 GH92 family glycosyl hydrolase [Sinomicrobium weinanense]